MERRCADARDTELFESIAHLARGLVRERHSEDLARRERAARDLMRDPARDRRGLARAGAREDADRSADGLHGAPLLGVQPVEDVHAATVPGGPDGIGPEPETKVEQLRNVSRRSGKIGASPSAAGRRFTRSRERTRPTAATDLRVTP